MGGYSYWYLELLCQGPACSGSPDKPSGVNLAYQFAKTQKSDLTAMVTKHHTTVPRLCAITIDSLLTSTHIHQPQV